MKALIFLSVSKKTPSKQSQTNKLHAVTYSNTVNSVTSFYEFCCYLHWNRETILPLHITIHTEWQRGFSKVYKILMGTDPTVPKSCPSLQVYWAEHTQDSQCFSVCSGCTTDCVCRYPRPKYDILTWESLARSGWLCVPLLHGRTRMLAFRILGWELHSGHTQRQREKCQQRLKVTSQSFWGWGEWEMNAQIVVLWDTYHGFKVQFHGWFNLT